MLKTRNGALLTAKRPEAELLLCCARTRRDTRTAAQIKTLLQTNIDWAYLLLTARQHGMMPLVFWHLDSCPEAIPEDVRGELRDHFHHNARRNLALTGELLKLLRLFEAHRIVALPYKGPILATIAYGNLVLREFADLDILVRKRDARRAGELLVSAGYRPEYELTPVQAATFVRHHSELAFRHAEYGMEVDVHWQIVEEFFSFLLDPEQLWGRLEEVPLGGITIPSLAPEDLLLILCVHGSKHHWVRLSWICDVAELIRRTNENLDWDQITKQATGLGSERMLFLGLYLAHDLLKAELPESVSRRLQADSKVKELAEQVHEHLFRETNDSTGVFGDIPFSSFHLKMRERLRDKIWYLVRAATTTTVRDWSVLPLPKYLFPLYYVVRAVRLTGKYGRRLLERVL